MIDKKTFHNLIDSVVALESQGMKTPEVFRTVLTEYFFRKQSEEKKFLSFMKGFDFPAFIEVTPSLLDVDMDQFRAYVEGTTPIDSLAGKIMLSKQYLRVFHSNYPSEFNKVPPNDQLELAEEVKNLNQGILSAFEKMKEDRSADMKRTMLTLVALIIKNIHLKNGVVLSQVKGSALEIIRGIIFDADDIYRATQPQNAELSDDLKIKSLIKAFCIVRKTSDLADITAMYREELERYRLRTAAAFSGK